LDLQAVGGGVRGHVAGWQRQKLKVSVPDWQGNWDWDLVERAKRFNRTYGPFEYPVILSACHLDFGCPCPGNKNVTANRRTHTHSHTLRHFFGSSVSLIRTYQDPKLGKRKQGHQCQFNFIFIVS